MGASGIRLFSKGAVIAFWLFLSLQYDENTDFLFSFPLVEFMAKALCWLFLWNFKEKASTIFYDTAFPYGEILSKLLLKYERLWKEHVIVIFRKEPFGRNKIR